MMRKLFSQSARVLWLWSILLLLAWRMVDLTPLFSAVFPQLPRPVYTQTGFLSLLRAHLFLVLVSASLSILVGVALGLWATSRWGRGARPLIELVIAIGQTIPPVAVLAICVPLMGFGAAPALIALALYGLLPIVEAVIAGRESVPQSVLDASLGMGLNAWQRLTQVEMPLALPVWLAGIRTSVIINVGTAAIASTVGAQSLGTPIIIGLTGYNTAYVLQGAVLVGLLAMGLDGLFAQLLQYITRWQGQSNTATN